VYVCVYSVKDIQTNKENGCVKDEFVSQRLKLSAVAYNLRRRCVLLKRAYSYAHLPAVT